MRFYTKKECEDWLNQRSRKKPGESTPHVQRIGYPTEPHRVFGLAHWLATSHTHRMPVLLWITEWGIWPSSENWHLYYRLRQTYGDQSLLQDAPGHLFLEHETNDFASFLQIGILNGWGGYVLTQANYLNAFFSHDEYMDFFVSDDKALDELRTSLSDAGLLNPS